MAKKKPAPDPIVRVRGGAKGFRMIPLSEWKKEKAQNRGKQK